MKTLIRVQLIKLMMLTGMTVMADTIDTTGQEPYEQCGYCHEYDGNSRMQIYPKLAGQTPAYIRKQLRDFRAGKRRGVMQATAELLSDKDIDVVASYFSQQKISTVSMPVMDQAEQKQASQLYFSGDKSRGITACASCHGSQAQGVGIFPGLAGQHPQYLAVQLKAFREGVRHNDEQGVMRKVSRSLSDVEIDRLSSYLAAGMPGRL